MFVYLRLQEYPTAVPTAIGVKMEAAGLANKPAGSVMEGMKVVMLSAISLMLAGWLLLLFDEWKRGKKSGR